MIKKFRVTVDGQTYQVEVEEISSSTSQSATEYIQPPQPPKTKTSPPQPQVKKTTTSHRDASQILAPMAGKVLRIVAKQGTEVTEGQVVMILDAMKMENEVYATKDGVIKEIAVSEEQAVNADDLLVVIE